MNNSMIRSEYVIDKNMLYATAYMQGRNLKPTRGNKYIWN